MTAPTRLAAALLYTTALAMSGFAPELAYAQSDPASAADAPPSGEDVAQPPQEDTPQEEPPQEETDVSIPGGGNTIVVTGARDRNLSKSSDQVVSVLSSAEIARTGEGNIAGALGRVTGLNVVGNGLVYVLTREALQQSSLTADLSTIESSFRQVNTDQRIVVNGLFGLGLEFGANKVRWTNLYIRDTIKQARLALGNRQQTTVDFLRQRTAWYERQLIDTHLVGEFKLAPSLNLDVRAGYANSQREAPDEMFL